MTEGSNRTFLLHWLSATPLLRGNWVALALSAVPMTLVFAVFLSGMAQDGSAWQLVAFIGALSLSLAAVMIQLPAYLGRIEVTPDTIIVMGRLSGRRGWLTIPRDEITQADYYGLQKPPGWLPFVWGIVELACIAGAVAAGGFAGSGAHWNWLTALMIGFCFWPLMVARWRSEMEVVLLYHRPDRSLGVIRAWASPHQAQALINMLRKNRLWDHPAEPPPPTD